MKLFLIDQLQKYAYEHLLSDVVNATSYFPSFRTKDLYSYFVNLIVAIVNDMPIVLIDSDVNSEEIKNHQLKNINTKVTIHNTRSFSSVKNIIDCLAESHSEITLFTSGTTGQPKKVTHKIAGLTRNSRREEKYSDNIWAFAYNPTHMAGLQVFFQAFQNSNTLVNVFNHSRKAVYELIAESSVTHISGTPTFFRLLLPFEKEYPSVTRITLGGEKSDETFHNSLKRIFPNAKINNIYASTEAGSLFATKGEYFQIPDSITNKVKIENSELLIHKDLLGSSDSFSFEEDYYKTGDLVEYLDSERGLFKFKGRANELINVGGYKVNPSEIETIIVQLPEVVQAVVYGKSNSVLGNILCCDIVLVEQSQLNEIAIREYLRNKVQDFKIPRRIKFVETIPLTKTGKLKRL